MHRNKSYHMRRASGEARQNIEMKGRLKGKAKRNLR
ncbi:hypothetical protein AYX15_07164 [Cryptococcus neoformans]|nr:hypothetical protein AYX15_07164 [Cryptococcus neoformans var. grubii]